MGQASRFRVTNVVEINSTQMKDLLQYANPDIRLVKEDDELSFEIPSGIDGARRPSIVFPNPVVFDIKCFSFEQPPNSDFWRPRFPGVTKIHLDRTWRDVLSFEEVQRMAKEERRYSLRRTAKELLQWLSALEAQSRGARGETSRETIMSTPARSSGPSQVIGTDLTTSSPHGVQELPGSFWHRLISSRLAAEGSGTDNTSKVFQLSRYSGFPILWLGHRGGVSEGPVHLLTQPHGSQRCRSS